MGEKINKVQIDFSKIYNDEYAAASGSGSHSVSEKNQEYWGNEGTQLEIVEVEAGGQKVYRIDEIQVDGSRVGMGFTTEDGIIQSIDSQNTPSEQNQNESHIKEDDAAQGDSGSSSKITEQQARAIENTTRASMAIEAQQDSKKWENFSEQIKKNCKLKAKLPSGEIYVNSKGTEFTFKNGIIINSTSANNEYTEYNEYGDATYRSYPDGTHIVIGRQSNTYDIIQHINDKNGTNYSVSNVTFSYNEDGTKKYSINGEVYAETRKDGGIKMRTNESDGGNDLDVVYYPDDGTEISISHNSNAIVGLENIDASEKDTNFFYKDGKITVHRKGYDELYDAKTGKFIQTID